MKLLRFEHFDEMAARAVALLSRHLQPATPLPTAVMLSGGATPLPIYRLAAERNIRASPSVHVLFSDERMVPARSPESNYGNARPFLEALGLADERILRVNPRRPLEAAARGYDEALAGFLRAGGRITLGLLGLGEDGHTASLFSAADVERGRGRRAIAVERRKKPDRVSVTPDLLAEAEKIVFLVAGAAKRDVVRRLVRDPASLPAGLAVAGCRNVELWVA